jgi:hypothetical protein
MACKALAWLVVFGLVGPAGAQEVVGGDRRNVQDEGLREDLPDNMDAFRRTPQTDDTPVTPEAGEEPGVGGSGRAGTGEGQRGELVGEVVRVQGDQLWLRHAGSDFPLALTDDTRFTPDRGRALRPGQEVRARFTLEGDGYVVNALEPVEQAPARGKSSGQKQGAEQPEAPKQ